MAYTARVLRVMIASPSEMTQARDVVESAINKWSLDYAQLRRTICLPWRWEESSVPELGGHPQELLNKQGVDTADIVIALFGERLGSRTPNALSGTVEEIQRAHGQAKPVHVYFSTAPLSGNFNQKQSRALKSFKKQIEGLYHEFEDASELPRKVWQAIEKDISELPPIEVPSIDASAVQEALYDRRLVAYATLADLATEMLQRALQDEASGLDSPREKGADLADLTNNFGPLEHAVNNVLMYGTEDTLDAARRVLEAIEDYVWSWDDYRSLDQALDDFRAAARADLGVA